MPFTMFVAGGIAIQARLTLDCYQKKLKRIFVDLFFSSSIAMIGGRCLLHVFWSTLLEYREPVPFRCSITGVFAFGAIVIRSLHIFTNSSDKNKMRKNRHRMFVYFLSWSWSMPIQLLGLSRLFKVMPSEIQWIVGLRCQSRHLQNLNEQSLSGPTFNACRTIIKNLILV